MPLAQTPNSENKLANTQTTYAVASADLPLHYPMSGMALWNSHPRVFLPIEKTGSTKCSYCGAEFALQKNET